jgi:hypothetical protein
MAKRRGRDGRALRDVDVSSEYLEVERRRYHERIRAELRERGVVKDTRTVEEAAPRLERKGWKVTRREQ